MGFLCCILRESCFAVCIGALSLKSIVPVVSIQKDGSGGADNWSGVAQCAQLPQLAGFFHLSFPYQWFCVEYGFWQGCRRDIQF